MTDVQDTGTPAVAAPEGDNLTPTFEADTPDQGSDSQSTGGTAEELEAIRTERDELKRRVSAGTMSWQQERAEREKLEKRLNRWKEAGINLDEIDRALDTVVPGTTGTQQQATHQLPQNVMTTEQFQQFMVLRDWEGAKERWFEKNPDLATEEVSDLLDAQARKLAAKEIQETGRLVSNPKELLKKAEAAVNRLQSRFEKKIQQKLTETRTKVGAQGVTETAHQKVVKPDDEDDTNKPMSKDEYLALYARRRAK